MCIKKTTVQTKIAATCIGDNRVLIPFCNTIKKPGGYPGFVSFRKNYFNTLSDSVAYVLVGSKAKVLFNNSLALALSLLA